MSCQRQFFALFVFLVYYSIMRIWWLNSDGGWFMNELCYLNRWQPEEAQTSPCPGPLTFSWVWPSWWVDCVGPHSKPILVIIILYYTCTSVLSKSQITCRYSWKNDKYTWLYWKIDMFTESDKKTCEKYWS